MKKKIIKFFFPIPAIVITTLIDRQHQQDDADDAKGVLVAHDHVEVFEIGRAHV